MVLPRISTNVSVIDIEPEADPLPLYLRPSPRMRALPAGTLVLPSHGKPFTGLHERIDAAAGAPRRTPGRGAGGLPRTRPCSAADLLQVLFKRKLDLHQTTFAMGEAIAHLHALHGAGRLAASAGRRRRAALRTRWLRLSPRGHRRGTARRERYDKAAAAPGSWHARPAGRAAARPTRHLP